MPYATLPDHRIPYDNDGTVVGQGANGEALGIASYPSGAVLQGWQTAAGATGGAGATSTYLVTWLFFPEQREVTAYYSHETNNGSPATTDLWKGSNDSTNGLDGTWETASLPGGESTWATVYDWRGAIKPISFTGGKRVVRLRSPNIGSGGQNTVLNQLHLYGEKVAGQTPNDIVYIDHDTTPGVEFTGPEDFGDRPLGTTVTRQFRIKNTSPSLTANSINIQCNDTENVISTDGTTWVVTINIGSLAAGAESATMYVRNTTPAAGNLLGPRFARIVTIVGSWT